MTDSSKKNSPLEQGSEDLERKVDALSEEITHLQIQNEALQKLVKNLQVESMTDDLTGIHNRRFFEREIVRCLASHDSRAHSFCLVLSDVDQLKLVNDLHGHSVGDQVLQKIAGQLAGLIRAGDSLSRIGGDEFAIVMPRTNLDECRSAVQQIVQRLDLSELSAQDIQVTLSFGCAVAEPNDSATFLFDRADKALYESKKSRT